ncbi:TetR/AcrR family transcriptional regulator [Sporichthya brevicatena]|uniref:TetR/AcrR family transcriptional regulator n=1 Tax=Sporichthya brevicatena TaxID=171442 RepID=A0ABN1H0L5_9ACTN
MSTVTPDRGAPERAPSARERLLRAADELFYAEGVNTVGIDRVIEHAGVAKASLYSAFGSKDGLIRAYLDRRREARARRIERHRSRHTDPRARLLAVFDAFDELAHSPQWRGCPFLAATGEARTDATVNEVLGQARRETRQCFLEDATALGVADPESLADQLVLIFDGGIVGAQNPLDPSAAVRARALAELVIDSAPR